MHDHEGRIISGKINRRTLLELTAFSAVASALSTPALANEGNEPRTKFRVDPFWPKPLPRELRGGLNREWVTGEVAGNAVDSRDHVFILNRRNLTGFEMQAGTASPAVIEFDRGGNVVNGWPPEPRPMPDPFLPDGLHGIFVDHEDNVWIGGNGDAIVQKYRHDGTFLMQIGEKRRFDSSDGTALGTPLNASRTLLNKPSDIAVDPTNNDIYISDGYGNHRVVVFNKNGNFLRQWGSAATLQEARAGAAGKFHGVVHGVKLGADGLVYVNDRAGDRIQVFDKMGNFQRNIWVNNGIAIGAGGAGSCWDLAFSSDKKQRFIYVTDGDQQINSTLDRRALSPSFANASALAKMGRSGHMAGEFTFLHTVAVDSKGNLYTAETVGGRRIQKFKDDGDQDDD